MTSLYCLLNPKFTYASLILRARRVGAEVAGWTLDREIRVRFPAYPHRVWALWWQGGKRRLRTSRCPCRGRLGTLKIPSCPWRGCPAAGQNLETGHLSRHYIAEISLNVTLNHNQLSSTDITPRNQCLIRYSPISYIFWTDFHASLNTTHFGLQNDQAIIKPWG